MKKYLLIMALMSGYVSADTATTVINGYRDIVGTCTISGNLYFDFKNVVKTDRATQRKVGQINLTCPSALNYSVYRFQNSAFRTNGVQSLYVNLFTDSSYTTLFNSANRMNLVGTGSNQQLTVYGELSLQADTYNSVLSWTGALHDDSPLGQNGGTFTTYTIINDVVIEF